MEITNIPRKYLLGLILVMVLILVTITSLNPGTLLFRDKTDYEAQKKLAAEQTKQYEALLASVQPDYQASQQLLKKIATEDVVRTEVENALDVNQKVVIPTVATSELNLSPRNDRPAMIEYVNRLASMMQNYTEDTKVAQTQVFAENANAGDIATARAKTAALTQNIRGLPVPADAVEMQKAYLVAYDTYGTFLNTANGYAKGTDDNPWPNVYNNYSVIDNRLAVAETEYSRLSQKYALNVPLPSDLSEQNSRFHLIKTADAQFAVIDVKAIIRDAIQLALARSFAKFAVTMLDKLVAHIEKSFAIASQLYYSQDLGRFYSVEYMKKFVADPTEQSIIQKFLPQYFCVNPNPGELKKIFTAKAMANQGTDIVIDPNDPQYLTKLARLGGDEKNYPGWWEDYYSTLAATTQQEAESAATKEVISPGLKSGRDLVTGQINKTMSSIFHVQESAIAATFNLGTSNATNPASQIVAGILENMINKFIFTPIGAGSSSGGSGIGIIAEQNVCLKVPQIKPIVPVAQTGSDPVDTEQQ